MVHQKRDAYREVGDGLVRPAKPFQEYPMHPLQFVAGPPMGT